MGAGAVLSRPACKPNPPTRIRTSDSDFGSRTSDLGLRPPTRTSDADFRLGPAKRILTSDFGLRHSVSVFGCQFERAHAFEGRPPPAAERLRSANAARREFVTGRLPGK